MDTLCVGHPVFELAFMWLAFVGFGELDPAVCSNFFKLPAELLKRFWGKTLRLYIGSEDESYALAFVVRLMLLVTKNIFSLCYSSNEFLTYTMSSLKAMFAK